MDKVEPHVAYYCRLHAMKEALKIKEKSPEDMKFLGDMMGWLEGNANLKMDNDEAQAKLQQFALQVFEHADTEDRSKPITKQTALKFHTASTFFDVCTQFGELPPDIKDKSVYAKWKVADITRAFKEGRTPLPGSIQEQQEEAQMAAELAKLETEAPEEETHAMGDQGLGDSSGFGLPDVPQTLGQPTPSYTQQPQEGAVDWEAELAKMKQKREGGRGGGGGGVSTQPLQQATPTYQPPAANPYSQPQASQPAPHYSASQPAPHYSVLRDTAPAATAPIAQQPQVQTQAGALVINPKTGMSRPQATSSAERLTKHALSALRFDDVPTAIEKLQLALSELLPHNSAGDRGF